MSLILILQYVYGFTMNTGYIIIIYYTVREKGQKVLRRIFYLLVILNGIPDAVKVVYDLSVVKTGPQVIEVMGVVAMFIAVFLLFWQEDLSKRRPEWMNRRNRRR